MYKEGLTRITTNVDYNIQLAPYSNIEFNPMGLTEDDYEELIDMEVDVDKFDIIFTASSRGTINVSIRPISEDTSWNFHPIKMVLSFEEASQAYKNLQGFIAELYANDEHVFDQNAIEMEVWNHNQKIWRKEGESIMKSNHYDKTKIYCTNGEVLHEMTPTLNYPFL